MIDDRLHNDIRNRLDRDFAFKEENGMLRGGTCPNCNKKTLYTNAQKAWVIRCGRLNKCGVELHVKDLYSDLFDNFGDRYPVTAANPNAAADAYLQQSRGFDLTKIAGWYKQESYYSPKLKIGSATVRFPLAGGGYWERIIDQAWRFGDRKANFNGGYKGTWWQAPNLELARVKEIWIVEGIFDTIGLLHVFDPKNMAAVSVMSCNNYPDTALQALAEQCKALDTPESPCQRPRLVWGFDGDAAGRGFTLKWHKRAIEQGWESTAAQIPQEGRKKLDWNDAYSLDRLTHKHLDDYRYHGALLIAEKPVDKALLIYNRTSRSQFDFVFDNRLYWFKLDLVAYHKETQELTDSHPHSDDLTTDEKLAIRDAALRNTYAITEIANCCFTPLYFQRRIITDESWYYFRIEFPHDGPAIKNTFTSSQFSASGEFKKRLLSIAAGAFFTGTNGQLDTLLKEKLFNIKVVETIDYIGFSKEHSTYVFGDVAISKGKVFELNDEDYFDIGKLAIKSLNQSVSLTINTELAAHKTDWLTLFYKAFGTRGIVALAFWFGSLFAEQIRHTQKTYPFLELVGEPGSGKTTIVEFFWKLCGRSGYEGFDPAKATTSARSRNFQQVANLPVVLNEGDRDQDSMKSKSFDFDELKPLYNGRGIRATGVKNSGNETHEPDFRGAVVISQNANVNASDAVLERLIHITFDKSTHTPATQKAASSLEHIDVADVSGFILMAAKAESSVMQTISERTPHWRTELNKKPDLRHQRIILNHAQIAALIEALRHVVPITDDHVEAAIDMVADMALARQQAINAEHELVSQFWELYDFIESEDDDNTVLNHSRKDDHVIAINLNHFEQVLADRHLRGPLIPELKRVLKTSRTHKFIEQRAINSAINARWNTRADRSATKPATVKCWVFEK